MQSRNNQSIFFLLYKINNIIYKLLNFMCLKIYIRNNYNNINMNIQNNKCKNIIY